MMEMSPYTVRPPSTLVKPDEVWTTKILANNIHCNSCVTRIEEILTGLGSGVLNVSVNILSHEIHVLHLSSVKPTSIRAALSDEAYEISAVTTVDKDDHVIYDTTLPANPAGWWDSLGPHSSARHPSCLPLPPRTERKRHEENCVACRTKEGGATCGPTTTVSLESKSGKAGLDLSPCVTPKETLRPAKILYGPPSLVGSSLKPAKSKEHLDLDLNHGSRDSDGRASRSPLFSVSLSVGGMTCVSCVNAIRAALEQLEFVREASVDLMTNSATVQLKGDKLLAQKIQGTIEDAGYEATVVQVSEMSPQEKQKPQADDVLSQYRVILGIGGMTCVSCVNAISQGLKDLTYVKKAEVALMTNSAEVIVEGKDHVQELVEKVEDLGYDCTFQSYDILESEAPQVAVQSASFRHIKIKIGGMYCEHCVPRILEMLKEKYASLVVIDRSPTLKMPVISISYRPRVPNFTIREILASIEQIDSNFDAKVFHPPTLEDRSKDLRIAERNRMLQRLVLSALAAVPSLLIGVVWMSLVAESNAIRQYFETPIWAGAVTRAEWALFVLATPVFFLAADVFHVRALREIRSLWRKGSKVPLLRRFYRFGSMNLLISAGTTVAYVSSLALLIIEATSSQAKTHAATYFDSVVFLTFFILIGRYLEAFGKAKAGNAVSMLGKLRPQEATLASTSNGRSDVDDSPRGPRERPVQTRTVDADSLEVGDIVVVPHGASPPADGTIVSGDGQFDESSLTGEARAVKKVVGDRVFVGTINTGGPITVKVTEIGGASMLDQIVTAVREGQTRRAPIERFADILTGYFVPVITAFAIITFCIWFALGQSGSLDPKYLEGQNGGWAFWSLEFAIAVFVVACPCGIGLAAPTSLFVGSGLAAKHGILVRGGGEAFQEASELDAVVFDKTGTLTEGGTLQVTDHEILAGADAQVCFAIARTLEEVSSHPIARAIHTFTSTRANTTVEATNMQEIPGLGLRGSFGFPAVSEKIHPRFEAAVGSEALVSTINPAILGNNTFASQTLETWKSQAKSVAVLALRSVEPDCDTTWTVAALFAVTDPVRPSAQPTVQALQARGIAVYMLSGDNAATARAVAGTVGIPVAHVFAGVLPTAKADKIRELRNTPELGRRGRGGREPRIAFVGDGINDAPALVAASVSVSLATASSIALSSSSFVLLSSPGGTEDASLAGLVTLLDLSRRVLRRVRANFAWALIYNVVLVPVAAGILFPINGGGWRLSPVWGAAAMALSSVSVVLSSLALRWERQWSWRFWKRAETEVV